MSSISYGSVVSVNPDGTVNALVDGQIISGLRTNFAGLGEAVIVDNSIAIGRSITVSTTSQSRPQSRPQSHLQSQFFDDSPGVFGDEFRNAEIERVVVDGEDEGSAFLGSVIEIEGDELTLTTEVWFPVEDFENNFIVYPPPTYVTRTISDNGPPYRIANFTSYVTSIEDDRITLVLPDIGVGNFAACGILSGHVHLITEDEEELISPDQVQVHHIYEARPRLYIKVDDYAFGYTATSQLDLDAALLYYDVKDEIEIIVAKNTSATGFKILFTAVTTIQVVTALHIEMSVVFNSVVTDLDNNITSFDSPNETILNMEKVDADHSIISTFTIKRSGPPSSFSAPYNVPALRIEKSDKSTVTDLNLPPDGQRQNVFTQARLDRVDTATTYVYPNSQVSIESGNIAVSCDAKPSQPTGGTPDGGASNTYTRYLLESTFFGSLQATMWHVNDQPYLIQGWTGNWPGNPFASQLQNDQQRLRVNADEMLQNERWASGNYYQGNLQEANFTSFITVSNFISIPQGGATLKIYGAVGIRETPAYPGDTSFPAIGTIFGIVVRVKVYRMEYIFDPGQNGFVYSVINPPVYESPVGSGDPVTGLRNGVKGLAKTLFLS